MHDLIKDDAILKSKEFGAEAAPNLSANKGKWLPRVTVRPPYDSATKTRALVKTVTATESVWTYAVTEKPAADVLAARLAELDDLTDAKKEAGVIVNGMEIGTDTDAITELTGALSLMGRNPNETTPFKAKNGWAVADKATLEAVQDAIWNHIKAVNVNSKAHYDALSALTTGQDIVDHDITTGWAA